MRTMLAILLLATSAHAAPSDTTWKQLHFLVGTWQAKTNAKGSAAATASGTYTFREDLAGNAITRTSSADTCKGPKSFDCDHHDSLVLYRENDQVEALYIDSEGHVIHYTVTTPDDHTAVFATAPTKTAPAFRLSYSLASKVMTGKFQGAAPGSTDFKSYLEWSGDRL